MRSTVLSLPLQLELLGFFMWSYLMLCCCKQECLSLSITSTLVKYLWARLGAVEPVTVLRFGMFQQGILKGEVSLYH